MVARRLMLALALLPCAAGSGAAVRTPPAIPEQPYIRTIYEWGDEIAVITEQFQPKEDDFIYRLYVVDHARSAIVPVRVPGCSSYHDVAHDARSGKLLLCGTGKSARAYQRSGGSWKAVSEPVPGNGFRLAVDGDRVATVSDQTAFLISLSSSNGRPARIPLAVKMPPRRMPSALLLTGDSLFLAQDMGEFGGGLYRMDLRDRSKSPVRLIKDNVAVLARTKSGVIWAAGGLSHLGGVSASLYRISADRVEVVAAVGGFEGGRRHDGRRIEEKIVEKSGVPFPALTDLAGLSLRREERPTVVLPELGVFELAGDRFVPLYEGKLSFFYEMPTHGAGSHPAGLAIGQSGDLYVASRTLGVFRLRKTDERFELRQLLFER